MIKEWPECPYCGEALESEMIYADLGPRLALFCTCEYFEDVQEALERDIRATLGEDDG